MAKTKAEKQEIITQITEKLSRSKSVVFADYQGMTMKQLLGLRDQLRLEQAEFAITKNTLLNLSLKEAHLKPQDDILDTGPTATLFAYGDEISPIKALVKALKDADLGSIKSGFLGTEYLSETQVRQLASLPGKKELQAKVVGTIAAPLYGIVNVLQGNIRNLVYALYQIKLSKGGE